jgi:hypothetical protein
VSKKPQGLPEFQSLLGRLAKVPKRELAREADKRKAKATKRKK